MRNLKYHMAGPWHSAKSLCFENHNVISFVLDIYLPYTAHNSQVLLHYKFKISLSVHFIFLTYPS